MSLPVQVPTPSPTRRATRAGKAASAALLFGSVLLLLVACSRESLSGPPDMRLGRDECGECGMLINEDRCSSAFLVERAGRREYIMFDDIGCMLDYEHQPRAEFTLIDAFVRDYPTREWISTDDAAFLFADPDNLPTPMGTGMVAFAQPAAARNKQSEVGGDIMTYPALAIARRQWMEARYGKPEEAR